MSNDTKQPTTEDVSNTTEERTKNDELSPDQLDKVNGGAFPTPVNGQITDVVVIM